MKISSILVRCFALVLAEPVAVCVYSATPQYTFSSIDVPAELGSSTSAYGINNLGVLAGNFVTVEGNLGGFIFQRRQFVHVTVAGADPADHGALNDVNDLGQAVGAFADGVTGVEHSFIRQRNGQITVLADATPDAPLTEVTGINNLGTMVGFYFDADFTAHGFTLFRNAYKTYDYPGALRTILTRINDRGQITGIRLDADGHRRGFVLHNGHTTTLDVPGSLNTRTGGINNRGDVVGYYDDAAGIAHGYLFRNGAFTTLD